MELLGNLRIARVRAHVVVACVAVGGLALGTGFAGADPDGYTVSTVQQFPSAGLSDLSGALTAGPAGTAYGFAEQSTNACAGGGQSSGEVFSIDASSGDVTPIHLFCPGTEDVSEPAQGLIYDAANHRLLGADPNGGPSDGSPGGEGDGEIFAINTQPGGSFGDLTAVKEFTDSSGPVGPEGLTLGSDGDIYGVSDGGGTSNNGTVFKLDPTSGQVTLLHSFPGMPGGGYPVAAPLLINHVLYGVTMSGGPDDVGEIYSVTDTGDDFTDLHDMADDGDQAAGDEGSGLSAPLTLGPDGDLYGVSMTGGAGPGAIGTAFKLTTAGANFTVLHSFGTDGSSYDSSDGTQPNGPLTLAGDGLLYGTTSFGQADSGGIFSLTEQGIETPVQSFDGPHGGLALLPDGSLLGSTNLEVFALTLPNAGTGTSTTSTSTTGTGTTTTTSTTMSSTQPVTTSASSTATVPVTSSTVPATTTPVQTVPTAVPVITAVSPGSGSTNGGTVVSINGAGFTLGSRVSFGSYGAESATVTSASSITAVSPPGSTTQTVDIRVITAGGVSTRVPGDRFTYVDDGSPVVTALAPAIGEPGEAVTVSGRHLTGASGVTFGSVTVPATDVAARPDGALEVIVPATAPRDSFVHVSNAVGSSGDGPGSRFTIDTTPVATGASPSQGPAGTLITVSGIHFDADTRLSLNGVDVPTTYRSAQTLEVTAPAAPASSVVSIVAHEVGTAAAPTPDAPTFRRITPCDFSVHYDCGGASAFVGSGTIAAFENPDPGTDHPNGALLESTTDSGSFASRSKQLGNDAFPAAQIDEGGLTSPFQLGVTADATATSDTFDSDFQIFASEDNLRIGYVRWQVSAAGGTSPHLLSLVFDPATDSDTDGAGTASGFVCVDARIGPASTSPQAPAQDVLAQGCDDNGVTSVAGNLNTVANTTNSDAPISLNFSLPSGTTNGDVLLYQTLLAQASAVAGPSSSDTAADDSSASATATVDPVLVSQTPGVSITPVLPADYHATAPMALGTGRGWAKHGSTIAISGIGFGSARGSVAVLSQNGGRALAARILSWSDRSVRVVLPAQALGPVFLKLTDAAKQTADELPLSITRTGAAAPAISTVSPAGGAVGTEVTISGVNFGSHPVVRFGSRRARLIRGSGTSIVARVPAGHGAVHVTVTDATGTSAPSPTATFSVLAPVSARLGRSGGVLSSRDGSVSVDLPPGALASAHTVRLVELAAAARLPKGTRSAGPAVLVDLGAITLRHPARLTIRPTVRSETGITTPWVVDDHGHRLASTVQPDGNVIVTLTRTTHAVTVTK